MNKKYGIFLCFSIIYFFNNIKFILFMFFSILKALWNNLNILGKVLKKPLHNYRDEKKGEMKKIW